MDQKSESRRDFLKAGAVAAGTALTTAAFPGGVFAAGSDEIKVGIIGCGDRGSGAGTNVLQAAKGVTIHALGDAFEDRLNGARRRLEGFAREDKTAANYGNKVDVAGRTFVGFDAYKKVIDSGVNYIILATPPGFRPIHIEAAVAAGKNVFTEKPVAVDGPGIRKVFEAEKESKKKKLGVAAGTQRRHQTGYREVMKRIHDGAIGDIVGGRCYWNQGILWAKKRQKDWNDVTYQMRNWYNFTWLCGDHIVEQHVHNIDVINWATQSHPVKALGMGFRTRTNPDYGHIYDFFAVDFEYPKGVHVISMCRQISNCAGGVYEGVQGTKGQAETQDRRRYLINGKPVFDPDNDNAPYVQEHTDLIESIRKGEPINELKNVAESTLSAIMGRMSAYTGKLITWEMALSSTENLMPENLDWDLKLPIPPVAVPGKTKFS
jgi:myo-inositol 2-dehydrogenase/D-chiro-inositol 1-dehydrogenase